jgi:hypothetical protein
MLGALLAGSLALSGDTPAQASFAGACSGTSGAADAFADAGLAADCLKAYGVSLGKDDGTFGERDQLKRSQVSSLLARLVQLANVTLNDGGGPTFSDVNERTVPNARVREEIAALAGSGIIAGFPDGTFQPADNLTVAQAVTLVIRSMAFVHDHDSNAPDVVDQGSTAANVPYAVHVGLLDTSAKDISGASYAHEAGDTSDRGLLADVIAQAIQQLVHAGVVAPFETPAPAGARSGVDRPDEQRGYQVHVVYATPADGPDHAYDTGGQIANAVSAINTWLSGQTGGSTLRFDTYQGAPDISFARLPRNDSDYVATGSFVRDNVQSDLHSAGFNDVNKLYAVFWDGGSNESCGGGAWPPTLVGNVAAMYLNGTPPGSPPCSSNVLGASATDPAYLEIAMLHEILHSIGIVPTCAPHHVGSGHTSDGNHDLMYQGPEPWLPDTLDIGHDDYFAAGIPGCLDLADSAFLEPLPAAAQTPPGWP